MRMTVTSMRHKGQAIDQKRIRDAPTVQGDVLIGQEQSPLLNRHAEVARVKGNGPLEPDPLPPLLDCRLSWMATGGFVLTGTTFDGTTAYAQSWWCRPM